MVFMSWLRADLVLHDGVRLLGSVAHHFYSHCDHYAAADQAREPQQFVNYLEQNSQSCIFEVDQTPPCAPSLSTGPIALLAVSGTRSQPELKSAA